MRKTLLGMTSIDTPRQRGGIQLQKSLVTSLLVSAKKMKFQVSNPRDVFPDRKGATLYALSAEVVMTSPLQSDGGRHLRLSWLVISVLQTGC
mmetsp:Transcript_76403/g.151143  ORF Transcript_76403/g.151143 Transcript_76403/m.151143 type:complete len:92 (+) Transcript_76403:1401-1676(+)